MNPNAQHHLRLDYSRLEMMIRQKRAEAGSFGYRYPGILVDSDDEENGADKEDFKTRVSKSVHSSEEDVN